MAMDDETSDSRLPVGAVPNYDELTLECMRTGRARTPVTLWRLSLCEQRFYGLTTEDFLQTAGYEVKPFIYCCF